MTDKKYINADALTEIREIDDEYYDTLERNNGTEFADGFATGWMCACDKIAKTIPAAAVEEVRRGKWIDRGHFTLMCEKCEAYVAKGLLLNDQIYYCPRCGAKMEKTDE